MRPEVELSIELVRELPGDVQAVVVPACSDELGSGEQNGTDWGYLRARGFEGRADQVFSLPAPGSAQAIVMVGLGPSAGVTPDVLRRASANAMRSCGRHARVATLLLDALPEDADAATRAAAARAIAEGAVLGAYRFTSYKTSGDPPALEHVAVIGAGGKRAQSAIDVGVAVATGASIARDLVNEPGGSLTSTALAQRAKNLAIEAGVEVDVWDQDRIIDAGLGGLLGVNRGSVHPARLVELSWSPERPRGHVALVGKGITFDSGGLSIKTAAGMMTMKDDMGGAAAIIGAMTVVPTIAPRCRVTAFLPCTDNMISGDATRPGDVLRMRNGKTVEVLNTDAEGRLILADALVLASEAKPDAILDLATLTGAVEVALGSRIAGLMGNHDGWIAQVQEAAAAAGERVWPLPMPGDYRKRLDSDVADLRNISRTTDGGSITAGLFLQEFVADGIPWAHLDIAGAAWSNEIDGELPKGATGFGVRTILELVKQFRKPS